MKTITHAIGFVMSIAMLFTLGTGCRKYSDGPAISFRSKTDRVANTWRVDRFFRNGTDESSHFKNAYINYRETYTKTGGFTYSYTDFLEIQHSNSGQWQFQNNENEIIQHGLKGNDAEIRTILRLTGDELWYWILENGEKTEYRMVNH